MIARKGRHGTLADDLLAEALSPALQPSTETILRGARHLIRAGEQGRAIKLIESNADCQLDDRVLDLCGLAQAQLRLAGASHATVNDLTRADVMAVQSLLDRRYGFLKDDGAPPRGIAIVLGTLGPAGIERQVVRLVRQLSGMADRRIAPISLMLVSRSKFEPGFQNHLVGLDVTIDRIVESQAEAGRSVPAGIKAKLNLLPPKIAAQAAYPLIVLGSVSPKSCLPWAKVLGLRPCWQGRLLVCREL